MLTELAVCFSVALSYNVHCTAGKQFVAYSEHIWFSFFTDGDVDAVDGHRTVQPLLPSDDGVILRTKTPHSAGTGLSIGDNVPESYALLMATTAKPVVTIKLHSQNFNSCIIFICGCVNICCIIDSRFASKY